MASMGDTDVDTGLSEKAQEAPEGALEDNSTVCSDNDMRSMRSNSTALSDSDMRSMRSNSTVLSDMDTRSMRSNSTVLSDNDMHSDNNMRSDITEIHPEVVSDLIDKARQAFEAALRDDVDEAQLDAVAEEEILPAVHPVRSDVTGTHPEVAPDLLGKARQALEAALRDDVDEAQLHADAEEEIVPAVHPVRSDVAGTHPEVTPDLLGKARQALEAALRDDVDEAQPDAEEEEILPAVHPVRSDIAGTHPEVTPDLLGKVRQALEAALRDDVHEAQLDAEEEEILPAVHPVRSDITGTHPEVAPDLMGKARQALEAALGDDVDEAQSDAETEEDILPAVQCVPAVAMVDELLQDDVSALPDEEHSVPAIHFAPAVAMVDELFSSFVRYLYSHISESEVMVDEGSSVSEPISVQLPSTAAPWLHDVDSCNSMVSMTEGSDVPTTTDVGTSEGSDTEGSEGSISSARNTVEALGYVEDLPEAGNREDILSAKPSAFTFEVASDNCAICLGPLVGEQVAVCADAEYGRVCQHYFHHSCLMGVRPRACPCCRAPFQRSAPLPSLDINPEEWGRLVAKKGSETLSQKEFTMGLLAYVCMPAEDLNNYVATGWPLWTLDKGNDAGLPVQRIALCTAALGQWLPYVEETPVEDEVDDDSDSDQEQNNEHQYEPGVICFCGSVHVRRGDRVRRGAAWREDCDDDGGAGQLGSVVRCHDESGNVFVHWDKDAPAVMCRYEWPGPPEQNEVQHVAFGYVPELLQAVRQQTGLSSAALQNLLRRLCIEPSQDAPATSGITEACLLAAATGLDELELRTTPNLYQRCRLLPDQEFVCRCFEHINMSNGHLGTVQNHLGREGYMLEVHDGDGTVLIEMAERCNCCMWVPRLAVEAVYDPLTASPPRFAVGHRVRCLTDDGWKPGTVKRIWYREPDWGNMPTAPYQVLLDSGDLIFAPVDDDRLINSA